MHTSPPFLSAFSNSLRVRKQINSCVNINICKLKSHERNPGIQPRSGEGLPVSFTSCKTSSVRFTDSEKLDQWLESSFDRNAHQIMKYHPKNQLLLSDGDHSCIFYWSQLCRGETGARDSTSLQFFSLLTELFLSLFTGTTEHKTVNVFQERLSENIGCYACIFKCCHVSPLVSNRCFYTIFSCGCLEQYFKLQKMCWTKGSLLIIL